MTANGWRRRPATAALLLTTACGTPGSRLAVAGYEQVQLGESYNWAFRHTHPETERLFNAFDFGHAIAYETLVRSSPHRSNAAALDGAVYRRVTVDVLPHPPRLPLEERAIGPSYAALIPELVAMFEWAHMLHRQLYDILSDRRIAPPEREAFVHALLAYYRSRPELALSSAPKGMSLMEQQPYSLVFRRSAPKYNGLLWSYHWLQMSVYDALLRSDDPVRQRAAVQGMVAHFRNMLVDAPARMPEIMPMSVAIAPLFSARYPEAAIIFDNLHALHDVVGDILSSRTFSASERRSLILTAAAAYRDSVTDVTSRDAWRAMSLSMGVERMGGRALPRE